MTPPTRRQRIIVAACFAAMLVVGLATFRDFGAGWDELAQRRIGEVTYNYLATGDPAIHSFEDRQYGPIIELPLYALEMAVHARDARTVFFMRHLAGFLIFVGGCWALYGLGRRLIGDPWGLIAAVALFTSPRLFADAFYNSKDVPFMAVTIVAMLTLVRLLEHPGVKRAIVHAIVCGVLIDIRILGVFLPAMTLGFLALEVAADRDRRLGASVRLAIAYLVALSIVVIVGWPAIWSHPIDSVVDAFDRMRHFDWNQRVLFRGELLTATSLPWFYLPQWIAMSTPAVYLSASVIGLVAALATVGRAPRAAFRAVDGRRLLLVIAWAIGPFAAILLFHSAVYDGWRHVFFIYPPLLLLGARVARDAWNAVAARPIRLRRAARGAVIVLGAGQLAVIGIFCVRNHPFENVYFGGFLAGDRQDLRQRYDLDYWGLSSRQALEWLAANDPSARISVGIGSSAVLLNYTMLPPDIRSRIVMIDPSDGKFTYWVTNFRYHPDEFPGTKLHSIMIGGAEIAAVYRE